MSAQDSPSSRTQKPWVWFVGLATLDVIQRIERWPGSNNKVTSTWQEIAPGGPATNASLACSALGGEAELHTGLGTGTAGAMIRGSVEEQGVRVKDWALANAVPALSSIILTGETGSRAIVSSDATGMDLIPPETLPSLDGCVALLIDGHHPRLACWAADLAGQRGIRIILDAGRWKPVMTELLQLATDVVCSGDFTVPETHDRASMIKEILRRGASRVAVTNGADPIIFSERGGEGIKHGEIPVPSVAAVDTLAAGDVFHGAYVYAVAHRKLAFAPALEFASQVAACKVQRLGQKEWLTALEKYPQ